MKQRLLRPLALGDIPNHRYGRTLTHVGDRDGCHLNIYNFPIQTQEFFLERLSGPVLLHHLPDSRHNDFMVIRMHKIENWFSKNLI